MTHEDAQHDLTALTARLTPAQIVGLTIWGEARGSTPVLRRAIASVIANRVKAQQPRWGLTPADVCLKPMQFSCWTPKGGVQNYAAVIKEAEKAAQDPLAWSKAAMFDTMYGDPIVAGTFKDTVHGATMYYSPAAMVPKTRVPAWARGLEPVADISGTLFFAGVT